MVDEDCAVQVIELVLQTYGQKTVGFNFEGLTVEILCADDDAVGANHLFIQPFERETAFLAFNELFRVGFDVGIDKNDEVVFLFGDVNDHDSLETAHLIGRKADAGGRIHGFSHVGGKLAELVVEFGDRLGFGGQNGIGILDNGQKSHETLLERVELVRPPILNQNGRSQTERTMKPESGREAECWIKLSLLTALSVPEILRLLQQTGNVEALFDASFRTLTKLAGESAARDIREINSNGEAERILSWMEDKEGVGFITLADPRYPRLMIEAGVAPVLLWHRGDAGLLEKPVLTVGGSTHPDKEALYNAEVFGETLGARSDLLLATGHFPGTEAAFLASALRTGARALVWQPCGPDRVWPSEGRGLLHELLDKNGLIMTPVPPGRGFTPEGRECQTYCRMACAQALLALNATTTSHLFSLARTAADWGRDVMAVPGSIHSPFARGCHRLIRQGAKLVESADDILSELRLAPG